MENPIVTPPIFVRFSLFLTSIHSENLIYLAVMVWKFELLKDPIEGDPLNLEPQISVKQKSSLISSIPQTLQPVHLAV